MSGQDLTSLLAIPFAFLLLLSLPGLRPSMAFWCHVMDRLALWVTAVSIAIVWAAWAGSGG